jgi:FlaA1/EpsC-like NDP-sugar epimerase
MGKLAVLALAAVVAVVAFKVYQLFVPSNRLSYSPNFDRAIPTTTEHFDYIIVGAGAAGCVLANRLSQKQNNSEPKVS